MSEADNSGPQSFLVAVDVDDNRQSEADNVNQRGEVVGHSIGPSKGDRLSFNNIPIYIHTYKSLSFFRIFTLCTCFTKYHYSVLTTTTPTYPHKSLNEDRYLNKDYSR